MTSIIVVVANYGFNENAKSLKSFFSSEFKTLLIDASSPETLGEADITIPNTYYPGLWNKAVEVAIEGDFDWLLFVASDIQLSQASMMNDCILQAACDPDISLWSPSLAKGSRFYFKQCGHNPVGIRRKSFFIEGFCFMARTHVLKEQFPIPPGVKYGWNIDMVTSAIALNHGSIVIDDRVQIFHPQRSRDHDINESEAIAEGITYRGRFPDSIQKAITQNEKASLASNQSSIAPYKPCNGLDLGCGGQPRNAFGLPKMWGIDIKNVRDESNIKVADLAISGIPFEDSLFSHVTAFDFIEHVPRLIYAPDRRFAFVELMNEIHRVLIPGGIFMSLTPCIPHEEAYQDPTHVNYISERTFRMYFCEPNSWASMYGFNGKFVLEHQELKSEGKLLTLMRSIK